MSQGAIALLVAFGVLQVAMLVARSIAPLLLTRCPFALAVLDGRTSTTLLLVERLPTAWFVVGATLGFVLGDLLAFPIGRVYGPRGTQVISRWLPTTGKILAVVERFMGATKGAPLIVTSGYAAAVVAGASGVGWWPFLFFNLTGVALRLWIVLQLARSFEDQFLWVGDFVDRFAVPLTLATVVLVGADLFMGRRRRNLNRERRSAERLGGLHAPNHREPSTARWEVQKSEATSRRAPRLPVRWWLVLWTHLKHPRRDRPP